MTESSADKFACESCGRSFVWKPELAGKEIKCPCGHVVTAPSLPSDLYELADEPTAQASQKTISVASPANRVKPINYYGPILANSDPYVPDPVRDFYMPVALISGSVVIRFGYAALFMRRGMISNIFHIAINVTLSTVAMLAAILIVGRVRKINFGPWAAASMKLCAIAIAPGAIGVLIAPILNLFPLSTLAIWFVEFIVYFALLGALLDLDQSDTWYCLCIIFLIDLVFYFAGLWM